MGSIFRGKPKEPEKKKLSSEAKLMAKMPPRLESEAIDPKEVMKSPEVDFKGKFPAGVVDGFDDHIRDGARGVLVDPEDEETRVFAFYEERIAELGRCDVKGHSELLTRLNTLRGGAVGAHGVRYRIETFNSLSDFGDRMVLNFLEEGRMNDEEILQRRRENIRLINKLKPATSLTRKNVLDMHGCVGRNPREKSFPDVLIKDELITQADVDRCKEAADPLLELMQQVVLPRKAAAAALAHYLGVPYIDVEEVSLDKGLARRLDKEYKLKKQVIPFSHDEKGTAKVAMMDPTDAALIADLKERLGMEIEPVCSAAQDIMVMVGKAHKSD